jgi:hypothetical protein
MWLPVTEVPPEEEGGSPLAFASRSHKDFALVCVCVCVFAYVCD